MNAATWGGARGGAGAHARARGVGEWAPSVAPLRPASLACEHLHSAEKTWPAGDAAGAPARTLSRASSYAVVARADSACTPRWTFELYSL